MNTSPYASSRVPKKSDPARTSDTGRSGRSGDRSAGAAATGHKATRPVAGRDAGHKGHGRRQHGFGEKERQLNSLGLPGADSLSPLPERGTFSVHVAPRGLLGPLLQELGTSVLAVRGRAVLAKGKQLPSWAQVTWTDPFWLEIASISEAAAKLSAVQRCWRAHLDRDSGLNRRATLIEQALPHVGARPLVFDQDLLSRLPAAPLGAFLLWDRNLVLASATTTSAFPDGEVPFVENRVDPPGRAYLKLWESFAVFGRMPRKDEFCLDLGAAPGSWSWVLGSLGARVFALDKAPLAQNVACMPGVEHCIGSGFALTPALTGRVDWLFSDMICYPERLLCLVRQFIDACAMRRAVCTIKFQSDADHDLVAAFAAVPGSQIRHLSCNRHELTWFYEEP